MNIVLNLEISSEKTFETNLDEVKYPVLKELINIILSYYPSIKMIKSKKKFKPRVFILNIFI